MLSAIVVLALASPPSAHADDERHSRLPLMAEEARERGIDLPLPFGAALVLTGLDNRKIEVSDLRLALEGSPGRSVSEFVELGSTSHVFNANLKLDAWLFPFLNLYWIVGYIHNQSNTRARVTLPAGASPFETEIDTDLEGVIGGAGITLAAGYQNFYMVADCNYSQSDLGFDNDFTALIASVRAGWNGRIRELPLQLWLGVGNWDTAATATGHAPLPNGAQLRFEADQHPQTNWMYDVGSNLQLSKRFHLFVDVGSDLQGGFLFVLGPTYRF